MSNIKTEYYSGPISRKGGYYIHYHQENIGKAENNSVPDIINVFKSQKQKALQESKNAYKYMFKKNLLNSSSIELLNEIFSDDNMMTELNNQMQKALEESIRVDKLQQLMAAQRGVTEGSGAFAKVYNKTGEDRIKAFSDLLETLSNCCKLLDSEQGSAIAVNLLNIKGSLSKTISNVNIGKKLQKAVKDFATTNEGATIDEQRVAAAAQSINAFANLLITKKTQKGEGLTSGSIQRMINHIFSDGFAEGVSSILNNTVDMNIDNAILSLEGRTTYKGTSIKASGVEKITDKTLAAGKVDILAKNVQFSIESKGGLTGGTIDINLGISNKTYRKNHFKGLDKRVGSQSYSSGSGGSVKEAINVIFGAKYSRYLAYNTIAHRSSRPQEAQALQDIILTRQITRLFSSRGGSKDFAQFIIANGQVVSVWDLIMQTENFVGLSNSINKKSQAVDLSIEGFAEVEKAKEIVNQAQRVYAVNQALNKATIQSYIHLDKLVQTLA